MRVVVLTTHTNNTPILYSALAASRSVSVITYDRMHSFDYLSEQVEQLNPDWVLYIGAIPEHHRLRVPSIPELKAIQRKKVHLCCDGADDAWWSLLGDYHTHNVFDLQINIDGVKAGPIGDHGWTTIAPIDPSGFGEPIPWSQRKTFAGFAGLVMGGDRAETLRALVAKDLITYRSRDEKGSGDYISWLKDCCVIWNHPETGGMKSQHVKARVIEAALAGCLVLEKLGSPLENWFEPGIEYFEWIDVEQIVLILDWVKENPSYAESHARRMRNKILTQYNVETFWQRVERRIGVRDLECVA